MWTRIGLMLSVLLGMRTESPADDLSKIRELTACLDFPLYAPTYSETAVHYEVKAPEECQAANPEPMTMINYFDKRGSYVFGLTEKKYLATETYEITEIDVKTGRKTTRIAERTVTLEPRGERVSINGCEGRYEAYIERGATGGGLRWIQSGTYMAVNSANLSKPSMIKIAESVKRVR